MNEFPKMLCTTVRNANGTSRQLPVVYPPGHVRVGQFVMFESADEERDYDHSGVVHHGRPEMHSQPSFSYLYEAPDWTTQIHQRKAGEVP
jgi:hypothetical protein